MNKPHEVTETMVQALRKKKILTIDELCAVAHRSPMTVWRTLKPIGYLTSFNYNARYYTLADTPRFDEHGLWFFRDVGFSSSGNLNRTLIRMVDSSLMGLTPNDITAMVRVRVQNQLHHLFAQHKVSRDQRGRSKLYLSANEAVRRNQMEQHELRKDRKLSAGQTPAPLSDNEVIAILSELVRTPRSSARRIAIVLSARGLNLTRDKVLAVIEKYELRKKGRRSRRSRS
jgi:hypothetical protein